MNKIHFSLLILSLFALNGCGVKPKAQRPLEKDRPQYFQINKPSVFLRKEPSFDSKVVSEVIYSEQVEIIKSPSCLDSKWIQIQATVDGYKGWLTKDCLTKMKGSLPNDNTVLKINRLRAHIYSVKDTEYGAVMTLPYGVKLKIKKEHEDANRRWIEVELIGSEKSFFIQRGDVTILPEKKICFDEIGKFSMRFLGLPYTWGGRSSFGFDCSGFCQMLYREMGILLPRNSKRQYVWEGFQRADFQDLRVGDLIFFGYQEGKISHVGMCIDPQEKLFIHTTMRELKPYLHISSLNDPEWDGSGELTFRAVRRLKS